MDRDRISTKTGARARERPCSIATCFDECQGLLVARPRARRKVYERVTFGALRVAAMYLAVGLASAPAGAGPRQSAPSSLSSAWNLLNSGDVDAAAAAF